MLIYDRGLLFGSCAGEAFAYPAIAFVITLVLAGVAGLIAARAKNKSLRVLPWLFLGIGTLVVLIIFAALFVGITARLELEGARLAVTSCHGPRESRESYDVATLTGRFVSTLR